MESYACTGENTAEPVGEEFSDLSKPYASDPEKAPAKTSVQARGETAAGPGDTKDESLTDPKCLKNFLREADIRLVRLEYLYKLAEAGRVWPRRQEADGEEFEDFDGKIRTALVTMEEIRNPRLRFGEGGGDRIILSVSHTWESQQHPDPWGWQLQSLLQHLQSSSTVLALSPATLLFLRRECNTEFWVFIDFMCLPQYKRSEEEQQFFKRAMRSMHLLYAHEYIGRVIRLEELTPESQKSTSGSISIYCENTGRFEPRPYGELVLNGTLYSMRGWCIAEVQWMSCQEVFDGFSPMVPAIFQERVARGEQGLADGLVLKFTHHSDAELVSQLQELVFLEHARKRTKLTASNLPQQEIVILGSALPHFVNLTHLSLINSSQRFGASIVELAHVLELLRPEKLVRLEVRGDGLMDAGATAIATAIVNCEKLSAISIESDDIGDAGAEALAAAVVECKNLTNFELFKSYRVGDAGLAALAAASFAVQWRNEALRPQTGQWCFFYVDGRLFLDEPSAAVDAGAKRHLWKVIRMRSRDQTVVLTTHSMEEAEVVRGQLRCLGTPLHIKGKYGSGYQLELFCDPPADEFSHEFWAAKAQELRRFVRRHLSPKGSLLEHHAGRWGTRSSGGRGCKSCSAGGLRQIVGKAHPMSRWLCLAIPYSRVNCRLSLSSCQNPFNLEPLNPKP
ncbi:ABCA5 [Symbiodinium sp. CCMP2592]|nr:ABCA5 [Symbiodinium sp. CCMP2592]